MANKFTPQTERAVYTRCDFTFNGGANPIAARFLSLFRTRLKNDDDPLKIRENLQDDRNHTFEALAVGFATKTVTITGLGSATYTQIVEGLNKMIEAEKPAQP
jgi:hypothetical protein